MKDKILLVDDDNNALAAYTRMLRKHFEPVVANSGAAALQIVQTEGPFAVVLADMHMPGMNGLELLTRIREIAPEMTRVMMTGDDEQKTAVDAVNRGQVFRFLTKPCSAEELVHTIEAGLHQYRLLRVEKEILEQTLSGAIQVMTELLSTLDPQAFGIATLLRERALKVASFLNVERDWEIGLSALLSPIGRLSISPHVLQKVQSGLPMSAEEMSLLERAPEFGARLLRRIPRMEGVAEAVRFQNKGFDGSGLPWDSVEGEAIPLAARILKPLADMMRIEHQGRSVLGSLEEMKSRAVLYDPKVLTAIISLTELELGLNPSANKASRSVTLGELREGQILASHVVTANGRLVLFPGIRLSAGHIQLLQNLAELLDLQEPIQIREPSAS